MPLNCGVGEDFWEFLGWVTEQQQQWLINLIWAVLLTVSLKGTTEPTSLSILMTMFPLPYSLGNLGSIFSHSQNSSSCNRLTQSLKKHKQNSVLMYFMFLRNWERLKATGSCVLMFLWTSQATLLVSNCYIHSLPWQTHGEEHASLVVANASRFTS